MIHNTFNNLNQDKKNRILQAAKREFINKGFDHAKVQSICTFADIPRSAFYRYFDSLEDCLEAIFENMREEKVSLFENLVSGKKGLDQLDSTLEILKIILEDEETFLFYIALIKSDMFHLPMIKSMRSKFRPPFQKKKEVLRKIISRNISGLAQEHYVHGVSKEACIEEYRQILQILKNGVTGGLIKKAKLPH